MKDYKCIICGNTSFLPLFKKGEIKQFHLHKCPDCSLEFLYPVPSETVLEECYNISYFSKRTDRGYDNYFSDNIRNEIERVFKLNIENLGFKKLSKNCGNKGRSLDIGCAAGYFVNYMKNAGWDANGIDVSAPCTEFAVNELKLSVKNGNYLKTEYREKFDLITMWATIEHLRKPEKFIQKIHSDLKEHGQLYLSTCRTGIFNFKIFFSKNWRYYNFPEHIFFFTEKNLKKLLSDNGFKIIKYRTYGSGINSKYRFLKTICDYAAKLFFSGDMMIIAAEKKAGNQ
ncbi:MAG: class I SAM-dependent methyltransferase [Spirochaetes bacterium]|nr:class I SAM-dependent methyltransferase [Spirochaetota bacterium]